MNSYIDTHCHLSDPRWMGDLSGVLDRARRAGVRAWLQGGVGPQDWERQAQITKQYSGFLPVFGLHPWWVGEHSDAEVGKALKALVPYLPAAVALGETGLDAMDRFNGTEERQKRAFLAQLDLAQTHQLPLVLHVVRAHADALSILRDRSNRGEPFRGIVHSFSGSVADAFAYIELGFLISFSGSITKMGFHAVKEAARQVPLASLAVETDAPDQCPAFVSAGLNEPANLIGIAAALANLREMSEEEVLKVSTSNVERMFGSRVTDALRAE